MLDGDKLVKALTDSLENLQKKALLQYELQPNPEILLFIEEISADIEMIKQIDEHTSKGG